jgi:hypothetical protein
MAPPRRPRSPSDPGSGSSGTKNPNSSKSGGSAKAKPPQMKPTGAGRVVGKSTVVMRGGPNTGQSRTLTAVSDPALEQAARQIQGAGGKVKLPPPNVSKTSGTFKGNAKVGPVRKGKTPSSWRSTSSGTKAAGSAAREGAARYGRSVKASQAEMEGNRNQQARSRSTGRNQTLGARGNRSFMSGQGRGGGNPQLGRKV